MGMRNDNGVIPNSFKALSGYLKIVSSGASTVASTVRSAASAASAVVERERDGETNHYQVSWAGFDRLESETGPARKVLLLGFSYGFQVWDVEVADNVHNLVSRNDGLVSFMQVLPKPLASIKSGDKFAGSRPLLTICADGTFAGDTNVQEASGVPYNGSIKHINGSINGSSSVPTVVWFYSMRSQSYVHLLRFRSIVHLVRCSSRIVAVLQSAQIHCLNAASLEREYTILTNPVTTGSYGLGNIGIGPLAVGPRWMAYSGSQVAVSNSRRVSPQHLAPSPSFPGHAPNGSLIAHYARESSKQLAAGIVTLGDIGYKKLSRYYSELLPEGNNFQSGTVRLKVNGAANGHSPDADNVGMVIVRDIVSKALIAQFRAHKSPILSLCFDPSGILLVTASIQGHNINVFRIMPGSSEGSSEPSYVHLYRLQRGFTNAVIQDISFSSDSHWIMISSSRGTSHLFAISPSGGSFSFQSANACSSAKNSVSSLRAKPVIHGFSSSGLQVLTQQTVCASGPPVILSAVSRIRSGSSNGWRNTVSGAAAAATWRLSSPSGAIASAFREGESSDMNGGLSSLKKSYYMLVFCPSGCMMQYALHFSPAFDGIAALPGVSSNHESNLDCDARLTVEAMQKWNICQKQNRKDQDNMDICGENVNFDTSTIYPEKLKCVNNGFSDVFGTAAKAKITNEKHHIYISEAELQMHQNQNPLWARPQIYFQSMQTDGTSINEGVCGGENEIERISTRMPEARSKDLVPVFDYLQVPKFQKGGNSILDRDNNGQYMPQGSDVSDGGSFDSVTNCGNLENGSDDALDENGQNGWFSENSGDFVDNTNDSSIMNTQSGDTVNTRKDSIRGSEVRFVNSRDGLTMENHFGEDNNFN